MCMEGIEQNPVVYDLMAEMAFHNATIDVKVSHHLFIYLHFTILYLALYGIVHISVLRICCFMEKTLGRRSPVEL